VADVRFWFGNLAKFARDGGGGAATKTVDA